MKLKLTPKICSWAIILAGAAIVWAMCMRAVWISDDMDYAYVMTHDYIPIIERVTGDETPQRITSFSDIVRSQVVHYEEVNGRAVAHTLIQWFCALGGRTLFAVCNAAVFVAFVLLLLWHGGGGTGHPRSVATVVVLYFSAFVTHMTPAFQICYVWMFTLALLWLRFLFDGTRRPGWSWPLLFVLGLLAGCGNEALNVGLSVAIFLWWLGRVRNVTPQQYVLIIGFALGCAVLVFSPGNFGRAERNEAFPSFMAFIFTLINFIGYTYVFLLPLISIVIWQIWHRKTTIKRIYKENAFWVNTFILCMVFGLALGSWANRLFFGMALGALILMIRILPKRGFNNFWLCAAATFSCWILVHEWAFVNSQRDEYERLRADFIAGTDGIVFTSCPTPERVFRGQTFSYAMPISESRMARSWRASLHSEFPEHAPLALIPAMLPAPGDSVISPYSLQLCTDAWLAVRPKGSDAKFISHHSIGIGPVRRHYKSLEVDWTNNVIDGGTWEAVYLPSAYVWRTLGLDSVTVVQNR